jgi:porphobilinogen synthase
MVKPSMPYLDIIADALRLTPDHLITFHQVSGGFAIIMLALKLVYMTYKP